MTNDLSLATSETQLLLKLGFSTQTEIQQQAIPVLAQGKSLMALAPTGSGKTLAFLLPLMGKISSELIETQLLILTPTRELGAQIAQVAETVARHIEVGVGRSLQVRTAFGGQKADSQKAEILKRPAIVVATPGRAQELLERDILQLDSLAAFVLDEADLMIGMGFEKQVRRICDFLPRDVQVALFSATETEFHSSLENRLIHRTVKIDVRAAVEAASPSTSDSSSGGDSSLTGSPTLHQALVIAPEQDKTGRLSHLLAEIAPSVKTGIIFCQTRDTVHLLAHSLRRAGLSVEALSGELGQVERATILRRFKAGGLQYLVATNLASRGIDVKELSVVINYDLPSTVEEYVHRSGRSGRAGSPGWTISLCSENTHGFLHSLLDNVGIVPRAYFAPALKGLALGEEAKVEKAPETRFFTKIHLNRGKSSKIRPGDILGALTKDLGLAREDVGSIFIFDHFTHVEVDERHADEIMVKLSQKRIKNMTVRATEASTLAAVRS